MNKTPSTYCTDYLSLHSDTELYLYQYNEVPVLTAAFNTLTVHRVRSREHNVGSVSAWRLIADRFVCVRNVPHV